MSRFRRFADRAGLVAFALYAALALIFFGRSLTGGLNNLYLGPGSDASFLMWAMAWWPYAIRHGLNPFLCRLVWAPAGFDLAWSGGMPLAAIVGAPLTAFAGPVVAYNLIGLAAPALAAWCAFILCRRLTGAWLPSALGGYLFGFSPYLLGQLIGGHLNLTLVFPAPLIALLIFLAITDAIAPVKFVALLATALVTQFLCSIELAATVAIFGAFGLLLGWSSAGGAGRGALLRLVRPLAWAAAMSLIMLYPYLYYLVWPGIPHGAINSPGGYSADLANLIVPTRTAEFGRIPLWQNIANRFPGNLGERSAYLGLPLLIVIFHYGLTQRRERTPRWLISALVIVTICALGPRLRVAGWSGFAMPWKLMTHVPILKSALPGRFMNYAFLSASVIVALWLADRRISRGWRVAAAGLVLLSMLPNLDAAIWTARANVPQLFSQRGYAAMLRRDETVVALPFGIRGNTMLWQAEAGFYFRMAGGYTGLTPREFERWPIVNAFMTATLLPDASAQLAAFMTAHDASVVVVDDAHRELWSSMLAAIDPAPRHTGGIWLYRASPAWMARYRGVSALAMEQANAEARFVALLTAARGYLVAGNDLSTLTPLRAQKLRLLPPNWVTDRDVRTNNGLYLGPGPDGKIAVGVVGSYDALQPLIEKYRAHASKILFPYPKELSGAPQGDTFMRLLVMTFDRDALAAVTAPALVR
ncbi:MAG TPA: hypothetical protein VKS22_15490 [Candidatus Binataceae bacterium]|nr:hypothetical protein [Candidatus Binataceae bacterium]